MKPTASDRIMARLREAGRPLPLHDLNIPGVSQTSASARLRELARAGWVESVRIPGVRYTAWLSKADLRLPL